MSAPMLPSRAALVSVLVWALGGAPGLQGQDADLDERVDRWIEAQRSERRIPGLAVAVIRDGEIVKLSAYGDASLELDVPVTTDTRFSVASVTKTFTAVAVGLLIEEGSVALDEGIGTYLPELPSAWHDVTVRQLLQHTSGVPDIAVDPYTTRTIAETAPEALEILQDRPMQFTPGEEWRYNATNYMLAAMLIERVTGDTFAAFLDERFFRPLEMSSATFGGGREVVESRATHYTWFDFGSGAPTVAEDLRVLDYPVSPASHAGGGLNLSVADFARWLLALQEGRFVSRALLEEMWRPAELGDGTVYERPPDAAWTHYGLGWVLNLREEHPWVGGTGGLRAAFAVFPDDDVAVAVLTNLQGSGPERLVEGVFERVVAD